MPERSFNDVEVTVGVASARLLDVGCAVALSLALVSCSTNEEADPTPTSEPPATSTPSPLFARDEAEQKASQFAASDQDVPSDVSELIVAGARVVIDCSSEENRYSPPHGTWVIHCEFLDASDVVPVLTARAAGEAPGFSLPTIHEKIYLVDDSTGEVRY